jgi:hypothetical protein
VEPCIFVLAEPNSQREVKAVRVFDANELASARPVSIPSTDWRDDESRYTFSSDQATQTLVKGLASRTSSLGDFFEVKTGLQAYEKGKGKPPQTAKDVKGHIFDRTEKDGEDCYPYLQGKDVGRYEVNWSESWMKYGPWLSQPRALSMFEGPRILLREITGKLPYALNFCFTDELFLSNKSVLTVLQKDSDRDELLAVLGLLNSRLVSVLYRASAVKGARKIFPKVVVRNLREFRLPSNWPAIDKAKLVRLSTNAMTLQTEVRNARTPAKSVSVERKLLETNRAIDRLVYGMYDLKDEEIAVVERRAELP